MKKLILIFCILTSLVLSAQTTEEQDKKAIAAVLEVQQNAWNNYDLEGFMQGYWKSDSLKFFGSNGVTYGWENTLANYKKGYPSKAYSGILKFTLHEISKITEGAYYVMGEYHLSRNVGDANGIFMIIFKKISGEWKIIADTSS
jgi:ketosteroid isomerase-like protein